MKSTHLHWFLLILSLQTPLEKLQSARELIDSAITDLQDQPPCPDCPRTA